MKNQLRKEFLEKRNALSQTLQIEKSNIIMDKLINSPDYVDADWVFTYIDMGSEVKTVPLIEKAWADHKRVAVPIAKANRLMYFVEITSFNGLTRTKLGVMEPKVGIEEEILPNERTLFVVPGSMFDEQKNRCGYGGGFYDTYTEEHHVNNTIGVCFDFQVIKEIPTEPFDRKLHKIITENRIIQ